MRKMARIVRQSLGNERLTRVAHSVVANAGGGRDDVAHVHAINEWLMEHFQFLRDPCAVEVLRSPLSYLDDIARTGRAIGDCDDAAMLAAAMGMSVGIPAAFVALAFFSQDAPFSHVITEFRTSRGIMKSDVTRSQRHLPPRAMRRLSVEI